MSLSSGGLTHVRYAHACRPRDLEVVCPRCSEVADARKRSETHAGLLVGDLSPSWNLSDWLITCRRCPFRAADWSYEDLPLCYWRLDVGAISVWAWNRDHLDFVRRYLLNESDQDEPFAWLGAYVPGEWKANADRVSQAISRKLKAG